MSSEKINTLFIYGMVAVLATVLIFSFFPAYNVRIETSQLVLVLIIVVLLLFPYFKIIEIPGFLKLSKEIEEIKSETKEIRQAQMTLMQAFTFSQSATASSEIHIHPVINQAVRDAREEAETFLSEPPSVNTADLSVSLNIIKSETDRIKQHVNRREYIAAFALLRSHIESLLKDVLGVGQTETRGFHQLLRDVKKRELLRPPLLESILSVRRFANTVLHMPPSAERELSPTEVDKIVDLGIRVIGELESIKRRRMPG
jgi:hypothetical protein